MLGAERVEGREDQIEIASSFGFGVGLGEGVRVAFGEGLDAERRARREILAHALGKGEGRRAGCFFALLGDERSQRYIEIALHVACLGELGGELVAAAFEGRIVGLDEGVDGDVRDLGELAFPERRHGVVVRGEAAGGAHQHGDEIAELVDPKAGLELDLSQAVGEELMRHAIEGRLVRPPHSGFVMREIRRAHVEAHRSRRLAVRLVDLRERRFEVPRRLRMIPAVLPRGLHREREVLPDRSGDDRRSSSAARGRGRRPPRWSRWRGSPPAVPGGRSR